MAYGRANSASMLLVLHWWYGCLTAILLLHAPSASAVTCSTNLAAVTNLTDFSPDGLQCTESSFRNFAYWALKKDNTTVSIVLAAPLVASQYAAFGFSGPGQMTGATAVVMTLGASGTLKAQQYYLKGQDQDQVYVDNTKLNLTEPMQAFYDAASRTAYVGFQVNFSRSQATANYMIYAQGPASADGSSISQHSDTAVDKLSSSQFPVDAVGLSEASKLQKKSRYMEPSTWLDGGVLLPVGVIVARYARDHDPAWFYIHMAVQITGFIFIIAGLVTGMNVGDSVDVNGVGTHQALGVFVFVLACLQLSAIFLRPKKDAKIRRYWNWYHWWAGRLALVLAAVNIFVGLNLGNEDNQGLEYSYVALLAVLLLTSAILETIYWLRWNRARRIGNQSPNEADFEAANNF